MSFTWSFHYSVRSQKKEHRKDEHLLLVEIKSDEMITINLHNFKNVIAGGVPKEKEENVMEESSWYRHKEAKSWLDEKDKQRNRKCNTLTHHENNTRGYRLNGTGKQPLCQKWSMCVTRSQIFLPALFSLLLRINHCWDRRASQQVFWWDILFLQKSIILQRIILDKAWFL